MVILLFIFIIIPIFSILGIILTIIGSIIKNKDKKSSLEQELNNNFGIEDDDSKYGIKRKYKGEKTLKIGLCLLTISGVMLLVSGILCSM